MADGGAVTKYDPTKDMPLGGDTTQSDAVIGLMSTEHGRAVVIGQVYQRPRGTRRRRGCCCCCVWSAVIIAGVILGIVRLISNSNKYSTYRTKSTWTWDNSDDTISDRVDITDDIEWWSGWSAFKTPATIKPSWSRTYVTRRPLLSRVRKTPKTHWSRAKTTKNLPSSNTETSSRLTTETRGTQENWTHYTSDAMSNLKTPCNDIFHYSCGGWISKTSIPNDFHRIDRFRENIRKVSKTLLEYLGKSSQNIAPEEKKAAKFYENCIRYGRSDRDAVLSKLYSLLQTVSRWTLKSSTSITDFQTLLTKLNAMNSWPIFKLLPRTTTDNATHIGVSVGDVAIKLNSLSKIKIPDIKLNDDITGKLQSKISAMRHAYGNQEHLSTTAVKAILQTHTNTNKLIFHKIWKVPLTRSSYSYPYSRYYRPYGSGYTATKITEDVLLLEVDLVLARSPGPVTKETETAKEVTVSELQRRCGIYSWNDYLKTITGKDIRKVVLLVPDAVFKVCDVIKKYTQTRFGSASYKKTLQNYILLRLVKNMLTYLGESVLLDDRFYSNELAKIVEDTKSTQCMQWTQTTFGLALGKMYLKETNYRVERHRKKVSTIVMHVRDHFKTILKESSWMDKETRVKALSKIDNSYLKLFYPPMINDSVKMERYYQKFLMNSNTWYLTVLDWMKFEFSEIKDSLTSPVDRSTWSISPTEVNAVYTPWLNDITIPVGILQPPFFDDRRPMVMNFGALGSIIGHELAHSVGDSGRRYNEFGQLDDWVSWDTKVLLQKKYKCFLDFYNSINYRFEQLNGNLTLEEDIADSIGIKASYGAYKTWKRHNKEILNKETQNWLKSGNITLDQLFFVAYSQMYCDKWTADGLKTLKSNKHSPGLLRVLGPFENNEFIRSKFSCRQSSKQQPKADKKGVWRIAAHISTKKAVKEVGKNKKLRKIFDD